MKERKVLSFQGDTHCTLCKFCASTGLRSSLRIFKACVVETRPEVCEVSCSVLILWRQFLSKSVYMWNRNFYVWGQEQMITKTKKKKKKKKWIYGKVLNKAQVAKRMCSIFAYESAHMLCEFCKTFQQMPFKTFTQRNQTMSPRRSWYNQAFCCSASAQPSFSPLSKHTLLPQHCLLLSHLKAQTQSILWFGCKPLQRDTFLKKIC